MKRWTSGSIRIGFSPEAVRKLFLAGVLLSASPVFCFQTEAPATTASSPRGIYDLMEAGLATPENVPQSVYQLANGNYEAALASLTPEHDAMLPWLRSYLEDALRVSRPLERTESDHFVVFTPPGQKFLADYALPSLEKTAAYIEKLFGARPKGKIRVEIYPSMEDFSAASTLTMETLERSGAIGICKFHRLMIMSPQSLPLGYRWLDALSHEYIHLMVNELTAAHAELWLHEGTARFLETAYRLNPPEFLTPDQKTKLLKAKEESRLVPFSRMSPSLVYLKDQDEVSLAFSQVSYAISRLVAEFGEKRFVDFLKSTARMPFGKAFEKSYSMSPTKFEAHWQAQLPKEKWEKTKGTMSDDIKFGPVSEDSIMGADVQGKVKLGDRMRQKGLLEAALIEYEKALAEEPDNAVVLLKAARTDLALNQSAKAIERLRRATEKNPNYGTPHIELAKLVEPAEALPHLLEANAINPFNPQIHEMLADIHEKSAKPSEANREKKIAESLR